MSDTDSSSYILRYNLILKQPEYFMGSDWYPYSTGTDTGSTLISSNVGPVTIFTVPVTGMYNLSYYLVNTTGGTGGDAVGQLVFNYTDPSGMNALYASMPSGINATLLGNGSAPLLLVAGSTVTYTEGSGVFAGGLVTTLAASVVKI